ncbi:MAG: response regulator [candidate division Zixibacteria bacterium]
MPRIMIVDDETYIQVLYRKEFESEGYIVKAVSNAEDALSLTEEFSPDIIILDIELGDVNGLELLKQFREKQANCSIILNSAYSTYKSDFQSWLADAYLMKSSDLAPLKDKVKELLAEDACGTK